MAHTKFAKTECAHDLFAALNCAQAPDSYGRAVSDARRQTRTRRRIPCRQTRAPTQSAHLRFAHADFDERAADVALAGCCATGRVGAEVVGRRAVNDKIKAARLSERHEFVVEFRLAEVATVARVCSVARVAHLFSLNNLMIEAEARGDL